MKIIALFFSFLLIACASGAKKPIGNLKPSGFRPLFLSYEIPVQTNPPGAAIYLNNYYIGKSPLKIKIEGNSNAVSAYTYQVRAVPSANGDCQQFQDIPSGAYLPKQIYFEMGLRHFLSACKQ